MIGPTGVARRKLRGASPGLAGCIRQVEAFEIHRGRLRRAATSNPWCAILVETSIDMVREEKLDEVAAPGRNKRRRALF